MDLKKDSALVPVVISLMKEGHRLVMNLNRHAAAD